MLNFKYYILQRTIDSHICLSPKMRLGSDRIKYHGFQTVVAHYIKSKPLFWIDWGGLDALKFAAPGYVKKSMKMMRAKLLYLRGK